MTTTSNRSYSELITFKTLEERFNYLKCNGLIGHQTFGGHRILNQAFYKSGEWLEFRRKMIVRDMGCDLGVRGYDIMNSVLVRVHHINPITINDVIYKSPKLLDPENAITTAHFTHEKIHYGTFDDVESRYLLTVRKPNDTKSW